MLRPFFRLKFPGHEWARLTGTSSSTVTVTDGRVVLEYFRLIVHQPEVSRAAARHFKAERAWTLSRHLRNGRILHGVWVLSGFISRCDVTFRGNLHAYDFFFFFPFPQARSVSYDINLTVSRYFSYFSLRSTLTGDMSSELLELELNFSTLNWFGEVLTRKRCPAECWLNLHAFLKTGIWIRN